MEQNKFQNGLIYTIKTDNGIYVGSTINFAQRKSKHKCACYNEKRKSYNLKLYQNIRENGGEYTIEIYKLFPCNSDKELCMEEENVRKELNANLNSQRCFVTNEEEKQTHIDWNKTHKEKCRLSSKKWIENNKEKQKEMDKICDKRKAQIITCECGCQLTKGTLLRHRKSKKHLNLMELKNFASPSWVLTATG